ncbi:unnamed protein product [Colias eurytheme]|nr:unnamed protein product [Colias eurytheme]
MPDGGSYKAKDITIDLLNRQLQNEHKCSTKQNLEVNENCQQNEDSNILCRSVRKPHDSIYTMNPYKINIPYDYRCYNPTNINSHSINYAGSNINIPCRNLDTAYDNTVSTAENNCENDINIASATTNYDSTDFPCCCINNPQKIDSILNLPQTVGNGNIVIPLTENANNEFNYPGINYAGSNIYANLKENLFKPKEKQVLLNIQKRPGSYIPYQLKLQETAPLKQYKIIANDLLINVENQDQNVLGNKPVITTNSQIPEPCVVENKKQNIDILPCYSASEILKMESDNDEENNNNEAISENPFYYQGDRVNYRPPYLDYKTFWTPHMYSNYRSKDIDTSFNNRYPYSAYYSTKINPFIPYQSYVSMRDNILIIGPKQQPFVGPIRDIPGVFKNLPLPNIEERPTSDSTQPEVFIKQLPNPWSKPFNNIPILNLEVKPNAESTKPDFGPSQNPRAKQYENEPVSNKEIDSYPEGSLYLPTVQPSISPWPKQIQNIPTYNINVKPNEDQRYIDQNLFFRHHKLLGQDR